jgi:hypothetical protein
MRCPLRLRLAGLGLAGLENDSELRARARVTVKLGSHRDGASPGFQWTRHVTGMMFQCLETSCKFNGRVLPLDGHGSHDDLAKKTVTVTGILHDLQVVSSVRGIRLIHWQISPATVT